MYNKLYTFIIACALSTATIMSSDTTDMNKIHEEVSLCDNREDLLKYWSTHAEIGERFFATGRTNYDYIVYQLKYNPINTKIFEIIRAREILLQLQDSYKPHSLLHSLKNVKLQAQK